MAQHRRSFSFRNLSFAAYVVVCLVGLVWPGYAWWGARFEPVVLGIPFSLTWVIGWVALTFLALLAYDLTRPRERE